MKLRVITAALLCLTAGMAMAQPPGPAGFDIERLTTLLDLDTNQKAAVQAVLDEQRTQMQTFREQAKTSEERPTREQMRTQREQMQNEMKEKLRGILSDTQMTKFEALTARPAGDPGKRWEKQSESDSDKSS